MDQDIYQSVLKSCHLLRFMAHGVSGLDDAISLAERAETLGPFIDPTAYQRKGDALLEDIRVLKAVRHFVSETAAPKAGVATE